MSWVGLREALSVLRVTRPEKERCLHPSLIPPLDQALISSGLQLYTVNCSGQSSEREHRTAAEESFSLSLGEQDRQIRSYHTEYRCGRR